MSSLDAHAEGKFRHHPKVKKEGGNGLRNTALSLGALLGAFGVIAGNETLKRNGVDIVATLNGNSEMAAANDRARAATEAYVANGTEPVEQRASGAPRVMYSREGTAYYPELLERLRQNPGTSFQIPENAVAARNSRTPGGYLVMFPDGSSMLVDDIYVNAPMNLDIGNMK